MSGDPNGGPSGATRRLFIGLKPPEDEAQRLARRTGPTLRDDGGEVPRGMRIYPEHDLHMTLCFLGAVDAKRVPTLEAALREELRGLNAPELVIAGTGAFPDLQRPRALWAGVEEADESPGRLAALHNRVLQAAFSIGWKRPRADRTRPFRPHITLARVLRDGAAPGLAVFGRLDFAQRWLPIEVALFESRPDRPEERYAALSAVPLVVRPG
ncbi:MAG: RNA 2',3'-cyclic phosphodiesterase [bacterium]|nr:RNA 2',3'-cyclic phosphodiesterase [bacterium]